MFKLSSKVLTASLLMTLFQMQAFADPRPTVLIHGTSDSLILAGKGVVDSQGNWIGVRCVTSEIHPTNSNDCSAFQSVYFDHGSNHFWEVGPTLPKENLALHLKSLGRAFSKEWRRRPGGYTVPIILIFAPLALSAGGAAIGIPLAAAAIQSSTFLGSWYGSTAMIGFIARSGRPVASKQGHSLLTPLHDQSGYNWSGRPGKISSKKMYYYLKFLLGVQAVQSENAFPIYENDGSGHPEAFQEGPSQNLSFNETENAFGYRLKGMEQNSPFLLKHGQLYLQHKGEVYTQDLPLREFENANGPHRYWKDVHGMTLP